MRSKAWFFLVSVLLASVLLVFFRKDVAAQAVTSDGWSLPENLSNSLTSSSAPAIVADQYGLVHVFWSEDLGGSPHDGLSAPGGGNSIIYRQLNKGTWSDAIDLFYDGSGAMLEGPAAVVDIDGLLHLVWTDGSGLEYSFARVWEATKVQSWLRPVQLASGMVTRVRVVDMGDRLLAVYNIVSGDQAGLYSVAIKGDLVLSPVLIWSGSSNAVPQDIGVAKDGRGRVHVVWSISIPPVPGAVEVRYTYMDNDSGAWVSSLMVSRETSAADSLQFAVPWVAARGEDEIHLQWSQGDKAYRSHQYSTDGGKTWTAPKRIWPDLLSQTNSQATGTDAAGRLYWADVLRFPNAGYLIPWGGNEWQRPIIFYEIQGDATDPMGSRINVHAIRMAISLGKEMYLVFQDQDRAEVWVMHKSLPVASVSPVLVPTPTLVSEVEGLGQDLSSEPALQPTSISFQSIDRSPSEEELSSGPGIVVFAGVLPVILLISILALKVARK